MAAVKEKKRKERKAWWFATSKNKREKQNETRPKIYKTSLLPLFFILHIQSIINFCWFSLYVFFFCTFVFSFIFLLSFAYFKSKLHFYRTDAIIMCAVNSASPGLVSLSFSKNFRDSYFLCQCFSVRVILNPRDSFGISWARTVFSP